MAIARFPLITLGVALTLYVVARAVELPADKFAVAFVFFGMLAATAVEFVARKRRVPSPEDGESGDPK